MNTGREDGRVVSGVTLPSLFGFARQPRPRVVGGSVGILSLRTLIGLLFCTLAGGVSAGSYFELPTQPPPAAYGNLLINRISVRNGIAPVVFPHWIHRARYTCRVCHIELGFNMAVNTTEITEKRNRHGQYCGACHNGKRSFGETDRHQCRRCHNGNRYVGEARFRKFAAGLPRTSFGNRIDWVKALHEGKIKPVRSLHPSAYKPLQFEKDLVLKAAWKMVPPAYFSHRIHDQWLGCANCHPSLFNIKRHTTRHFSMVANLNGRFCGSCHLRVAFPLDDCRRCHPKMR